ncbi:RidA family protein [Rhodobacteraceae bacterium]|nr:RidA family protein [Paracoccaceae bacterium]
MEIEQRIAALGLQLPTMPTANGKYRTWHIDNGLFLTSGQLSRVDDEVIRGPIRSDDDLEQAKEAARICALRCLSVARSALNDLGAIDQILSVRGFVAASADFTRHSEVLDGASELLVELFGIKGDHIRTAVGVSSLPAGGLIEIEMTARVTTAIGQLHLKPNYDLAP